MTAKLPEGYLVKPSYWYKMPQDGKRHLRCKMNAPLISHMHTATTATAVFLFQTEILETSNMNAHVGNTIAEG